METSILILRGAVYFNDINYGQPVLKFFIIKALNIQCTFTLKYNSDKLGKSP